MSIDESKVPDRATCQKLTENFAEITGTNEALAQTFLQDYEWNLDISVCAFYDALNKETEQTSKRQESSLNFDVVFPETSTDSNTIESKALYDPVTVEKLFGEGKTITTKPPPNMKLLSWNLDGLNVQNLKKRTRAVIKIIQKYEFDIIFFQEVIPESAEYFESKLPEYKCIKGGEAEYFTMTLLRIFTVFYDHHSIVNYPASVMGRNLLITEAHISKLKLQLLNTHLESTSDHSSERKSQLKTAFDKCLSFGDEYTVIFGGDLNLRDKEVVVPKNFFDLWEFCGSPKEFKYTWDMTRNTNNSNFGKYKPRCRFDRIYFRPSIPKKAMPQQFALIGCEKVAQTQTFPSDHWGVIVLFDLDHNV